MKNFGELSLRLALTMAFVIASNAFSDDGGNAAVTEFQDGKVEAPRGLSSSQKAGATCYAS